MPTIEDSFDYIDNEEWMTDEDYEREFNPEYKESNNRVSKRNKNITCKKNKLNGNNYGPHKYIEGSTECMLCGHVKKQVLDVKKLMD